jgi:uncharacterized protein YlxP (DUF503 family)
MIVGVCRLTLMAPESHSLKEKRMVLRSIKDRARQKFNVAIAEVGAQDNWQEAVLGFAVVANEKGFVREMLAKIVNFIDALAIAKIIDEEQDIVQYGEGEALAQDGGAHWEPEK